MTQKTLEHEQTVLFIPDVKRGAVLALLLLAGLLAGMLLVMWVQQIVHPYHPLVFEEAAREALENGDYQRVVTLCTGNLNYTGQHFPTHGAAYLLRAKAHWGLDRAHRAAEDIAGAESRWRAAFRSAETSDRRELKEFATHVGMHFLADGNTEQALRLFSLAGTGSAEPLAYIDELRGALSDEMAAAIWPGEPYLIVEDFERSASVLFAEWYRVSEREVNVARITKQCEKSNKPVHAVRVEAGPAREAGRTWYFIPFFMRIPEHPCRIRATVVPEQGLPPQLVLHELYPETNIRRNTMGEAPFSPEDGRYFAEVELPGRSKDGPAGYIARIALALPPEACEFLVERIELLPGDGNEGNGDG